MNNQNQVTTPQIFMCKIIKKLHTHKIEQIPYEDFQHITQLNVYQTILSLQDIIINSSNSHPIHNPNIKGQIYLERQEFIIPKQIKKIGSVVKILANLIQFHNQEQKLLAFFQFTQFYRSFNRVKSQYFVDLLKGIFPKSNVHKDNLPLFMPFYQSLQSYYSNIIGNTNWELSRQALDFIYKQQILNGQPLQIWYLLLTGHIDLQKRLCNTAIETLWSNLYIFYMKQTLKPYKINFQQVGIQQLSIRSIIKLGKDLFQKQQSSWNKLIISLILVILTNQVDQINISYQTFTSFYDIQLKQYLNHQTQKEQISILGLINTYFHQQFLNQKQIYQKTQGQNIIRIITLQKLIKKSLQLNQTFITERIPYHDFFLRIFYPANDPSNRFSNDQKILQIFIKQIQKDQSINAYQFPQYPYQPQFYQKLSKIYFQKYPTKILQVYKYLDKQTAIFQLLNCKALNQFQGFISIKKALQQNQEKYIEEIKKKIQISKQEYDNFIKIWQKYHELINFQPKQSLNMVEYQIKKVRKAKFILQQIINELKLSPNFITQVYLPLNDTSNITKIMNFIIQGFQQCCQDIKYSTNKQQQLIKTYNEFLKWPLLKTYLLQKLSQQQYDELWKKWIIVNINDQNFIKELLSTSNNNQDNYYNNNDSNNRIVEEQHSVQNHVMEIQ